jgi:hypothetical protein
MKRGQRSVSREAPHLGLVELAQVGLRTPQLHHGAGIGGVHIERLAEQRHGLGEPAGLQELLSDQRARGSCWKLG